jgi:hypothetical protein
MEINTLERLKRELESFKLLTTANMVGAALTVASRARALNGTQQ